MARKLPPPKQSAPAAPKQPDAPQPPTWQSVATALLMLHFFCLGTGLIANAAGGKSMLGPALRQIPGIPQYLRFIGMDVSYDFYLSSPLADDGANRLKLAAHSSDSSEALDTLPDVVELTDDAMQPRIRRIRYQQLAYSVAFFDELYAENSDLRTQLPLAISETWLRELDAPHESYVLTCVREPVKRLPKAIERAPAKVREGGPRMAGPAQFAPETITYNIVWDPDEQRYQGSHFEAPGQNSEVVQAAAPKADVEMPAADVPDVDNEPGAQLLPGATLPGGAQPAIDPGEPTAPAPIETDTSGGK